MTSLRDVVVTNDASSELDLASVCGLMGFSLAVTWFMTLLLTPFPYAPLLESLNTEWVMRSVCLTGMVCGYFFIILFARNILRTLGRLLQSLIPAIGSLLFLFSFDLLAANQVIFILISWFLLGLTIAILFFRSGLFFAATSSRFASLSLGIATALGILVYVIITNMYEEVAFVVIALLPLAASGLFSLQKTIHPQEKNYDDIEPAKLWHFTSWQSIPNQLVFGLAFGLSLFCYVSQFRNNQTNFDPAAFVFALAGIGFCVIILAVKQDMIVSQIQRFLMPLLAVGLLPIMLHIPSVTFASCLLLLCCYCLYDLTHTVAMTDIMREERQAAIAVFAGGKLIVGTGILIGWAISFNIITTLGLESTEFGLFLIVITLLLVITLACTEYISSKNTTTITLRGNVEKEGWRQRCIRLCEEVKLSPRQQEVFMLLAKGRNFQYIADELFITTHTVKAHTYRIYQKMDIHSQQELIDMVELMGQTKNA